MGASKKYYYAVQRGSNPGVYSTWEQCRKQVNGISGAVFKKFDTPQEAEAFAQGGSSHRSSSNDSYSSSQNHNSGKSSNSNTYSGQSRSTSYSKPASYSPYTSSNRNSNHRSSIKTSGNDCNNVFSGYIRVEPAAPETKRTVVYTDGASSNNGRTNARAGYGVFYGDNDSRNASVRLIGKQTNQRAEASAVVHALRQNKNNKVPLEIRTDSQYVINAATDWSNNWAQNGWKSVNGKPVENKDLFQEIQQLMTERMAPVEFTYVPGHQGVYGNEMADKLAVRGAGME